MSTPRPLAPDAPEIDPSFHHVLGSMPGVAYVEAGGLDGPTVYMSPRIERLTGHQPARFLESRDFWLTLVHPDDRARVETAVEVSNMSSSYLEEYRMVAADGRVVWVRDEAVHVPATERRPAHWIGLLVDITREKEAETRVAEVEQRYRTLIEQLPIVTYIDVPDDSLANLFVSPQINDLLGRPSGATGEEWAERVHPEDRDRAHRETVEGVRSGEPFSLEYRMVRDDGREIWVRDSATTVRNDVSGSEYVLGFFFDITQRKEVELQLEELERRYRNLVEQLPAVTYMDTADEEMSAIYVSPQVETVLGLSAEAFMDDDAWAAHLHPDDREQALQKLREAVRVGVPFTLEYRMIRPDGSVVWIRDQGTVVRDEAGLPSYVQGLYVDISEQKRLETELRSEAVKFKSLAEQIPAVVYIEGEGGSDDAPFYMSPQYEELFGY
ncbi:MAG: PAS domain-containing protein, partial [Actinomycetota bacterium]|nr:PAS domain-containing protein [Actinomycetota bacterium]